MEANLSSIYDAGLTDLRNEDDISVDVDEYIKYETICAYRNLAWTGRYFLRRSFPGPTAAGHQR